MMLFMAYLGVVSEAGWLLDATPPARAISSAAREFISGLCFVTEEMCLQSTFRIWYTSQFAYGFLGRLCLGNSGLDQVQVRAHAYLRYF